MSICTVRIPLSDVSRVDTYSILKTKLQGTAGKRVCKDLLQSLATTDLQDLVSQRSITMFDGVKHALRKRGHKSSQSLMRETHPGESAGLPLRRSSIDLAAVQSRPIAFLNHQKNGTYGDEEGVLGHVAGRESRSRESETCQEAYGEDRQGLHKIERHFQQLTGGGDEEERCIVDLIGENSATMGSYRTESLLAANHGAIIQRSQGKYQAAEETIRLVMQSATMNIDRDDPLLLMNDNNLAVILQDQAKLDEAEALFRRVFDVRKRVLGLQHHLTLISLNNLATILRDKGHHHEAERLIRLSLEVGIEVLGQAHLDMFTFADNLGVVLRLGLG